MICLHEWSRRIRVTEKPWLVIGKGPSFVQHRAHDLSAYHTLGLNHVVRELPVSAAHMIDLEVVEDTAAALERHAEYLLMPLRPHESCRPSRWDLGHFVRRLDVLKRFDRAGRLVWYHLSTSRRWWPVRHPVIRVRYFSAEAAIGLLAACGVRTIRSLGVDGGRRYSTEFQDLTGTTLLRNGRTSFDEQFAAIQELVGRAGLDYAPLARLDPP